MAASIVQAKFNISQAGSSNATITISPDSPFASGNYVWVIAWGNATMATASISDTVNSYTALGSDGYDLCWARHWYAPVATGTPTITVTPASNRNMTIALIEVTGVDSGGPVELSGDSWQLWSSANFPASPLNFGAVTETDQIIMGIVGSAPSQANVRDHGAGTGWTVHSENNGGPTICLIYQNITSAGTYDPEWTMPSGGSYQMVFAGISFVSSAGSPDVTDNIDGSAMTPNAGTQTPNFSIPL